MNFRHVWTWVLLVLLSTDGDLGHIIYLSGLSFLVNKIGIIIIG